MIEPDRLVEWQERCRQVEVPPGFVDHVMQVIDATPRTNGMARVPPLSARAFLALAAGVLLIVFLHAGTVGLGLFAMMGVAQ